MPQVKLTVAEYLAIDRRAEIRSEFHDGVMFQVPRRSIAHNRVTVNLGGEIGLRLKGGPCQSFSLTLRVLVERTGFFCYPDLLIVCGEPRFAEVDRDTLTNPRVLFEVVSPSTQRYDRVTKFHRYKELSSLQEYVLVEEDRAWCERYVRQPDGSWALMHFVGLDATLELKSVPVAVPLADVYARVTFPPPEPAPGGQLR